MLGTNDPIPGLVSVLVPTYNHKDFVEQTLNSVLEQDYASIEIVVADDGSTDGTQAIIQEYAARHPAKIITVISPRNTGIPSNFNRGLRAVKGEFIAWLGGDDLMNPGKIRKQVELLRLRQDAVGCCHEAEVFNSQDGKTLGLFSTLYNGRTGYREGGVELWFDASYSMLPSTVMIRSSAAPPHGLDERLRWACDWLFDVEVFRKGKCVVINEVLGKYRRHANNVTANPSTRRQGNEEAVIALAIVDSRYPELHRLVRKRRSAFFLAAARRAYTAGDWKTCIRHLRIAFDDGALIRAPLGLIALMLFGSYISRQMAKPPLERSLLFLKLSSFLKGRA